MLSMREGALSLVFFLSLVTTLIAVGSETGPSGGDPIEPIAMSVLHQHYANAAAFQDRTTFFCGGVGPVAILLYPGGSLNPPC